MRTASRSARKVLWLGAMALAAGCSSGGGGGTGGKGGGTGGTTGTGAGVGKGSGGAAGAGSGGTAGMAAGSGGGGGSAGAGGIAGGGGAGGGCAGGAPAVTQGTQCAAFPGPATNAGGAGGHGGAGGAGGAQFSLSSPDFDSCGPIPKAMTCDGNAFGTGTNPSLTWSGAPAGTKSFAIVFKDLSVIASAAPPLNLQHGYHWAIWDIPASVTTLPHNLATGYHSTDIPGALQWSQRNNYGFFPPCPNPFPAGDARFSCSLSLDSYSFTIYAFSFDHLPNLPTPDLNANGQPTGNYAVNVAQSIESLSALAIAEYRGTSQAWASTFTPPTPVEYPCSAADRIDGGTPEDGGVKLDGATLMCLP